MRDIQVQHSFSTLGATCLSQRTSVRLTEKSTVYRFSDSPSHGHPVTLCSVISTHCFVPVPTDLFWGENSTAITIAHVDINTHRTTSCQETLKTSKIAHKHKGETLETIQKESNCVSYMLNFDNLTSATKSHIYSNTFLPKENVYL